MEKDIIIVSISLAILAVAMVFLSLNIFQLNITSSAIVETHSLTKAICDNENYCQDYIIKCSGNKILSTNPITGAVAQFPIDWKDPRSDLEIDNFC